MSPLQWTKREEELFKQAWNSTSYAREDLERLFQRSFTALDHKARRMGLLDRRQIEQMARVEALEKTLKEDHVID